MNNRLNALIITAIAFLTGCDKHETAIQAGDIPMELNACTFTVETRIPKDIDPTGGVITGTIFPTSRSMRLSATTQTGTQYLSNSLFSYTSPSWKSSPASYWPLDGTLDFLAYSEGLTWLTPTWTGTTSVAMTSSDFTADDLLVGTLEGASQTNNNITFHHALAQVKFRIRASAESAIVMKSATISASKSGTITATRTDGSSELSISNTLDSETNVTIFQNVNNTSYVTTSYTSFGATLLLPSQTPSSITLNYSTSSASTGAPVYSKTVTINQLCLPERIYTFDLDISLTGITVTPSVSEWIDEGTSAVSVNLDGGDVYAGHEAVDLGLRRTINNIEYKVLFATTNIGASSSEEFGDYFYFAEPYKNYDYVDWNRNIGTAQSPSYVLVGGDFSFENTPYYIGDGSTQNGPYWTKYVSSNAPTYWGGESIPDNKLTLDSYDDAACVQWGGGWHLPDKEDLYLLINKDTNYVTYEWVDNWNNTGKSGFLWTGKGEFASNTLFLPAQGIIFGQNVQRINALNGFTYRSRNVTLHNGYCDFELFWYNETLVVDSSNKSYGKAIRPVILIPV